MVHCYIVYSTINIEIPLNMEKIVSGIFDFFFD